jgi:predicted RNA-binding Zn-ribbon protein involved in translation (DUF1610 family)
MSLFWLLFCGLVAYFASEKNRNPILWGLLALFFSPLLVGIALALMKDLSVEEELDHLDKTTQNLKREVKSNHQYNQQQRNKINNKLTGKNETNKINSNEQQQALTAKKIDCPNCNTPIPQNKDAKFCPNCGTELIDKCPNCNREITTDSAFCLECGTEI